MSKREAKAPSRLQVDVEETARVPAPRRPSSSTAARNRERNRVHARRSRLRKKAFVETLRLQLESLNPIITSVRSLFRRTVGRPFTTRSPDVAKEVNRAAEDLMERAGAGEDFDDDEDDDVDGSGRPKSTRISAALAAAATAAPQKRFSSTDPLQRHRDRNKEHARMSRLRKKLLMEELRLRLDALEGDYNDMLTELVTRLGPDHDEVVALKKQMAQREDMYKMLSDDEDDDEGLEEGDDGETGTRTPPEDDGGGAGGEDGGDASQAGNGRPQRARKSSGRGDAPAKGRGKRAPSAGGRGPTTTSTARRGGGATTPGTTASTGGSVQSGSGGGVGDARTSDEDDRSSADNDSAHHSFGVTGDEEEANDTAASPVADTAEEHRYFAGVLGRVRSGVASAHHTDYDTHATLNGEAERRRGTARRMTRSTRRPRDDTVVGSAHLGFYSQSPGASSGGEEGKPRRVSVPVAAGGDDHPPAAALAGHKRAREGAVDQRSRRHVRPDAVAGGSGGGTGTSGTEPGGESGSREEDVEDSRPTKHARLTAGNETGGNEPPTSTSGPMPRSCSTSDALNLLALAALH